MPLATSTSGTSASIVSRPTTRPRARRALSNPIMRGDDGRPTSVSPGARTTGNRRIASSARGSAHLDRRVARVGELAIAPASMQRADRRGDRARGLRRQAELDRLVDEDEPGAQRALHREIASEPRAGLRIARAGARRRHRHLSASVQRPASSSASAREAGSARSGQPAAAATPASSDADERSEEKHAMMHGLQARDAGEEHAVRIEGDRLGLRSKCPASGRSRAPRRGRRRSSAMLTIRRRR